MSLTPLARRAIVFAFILAGTGCQPGVRENRTITFDSNGRAAFQHGANGVFVTDPKTGAPKRIYESVPGDIAVSPPAWDSGGKRMVFTVARALPDQPLEPLGDAPADGRRYPEIPITYTCWLYDPTVDGSPQKLFEAAAGHPGYVATGLAVSWHADGKHLDFVERVGDGHRVRTFDLATNIAEDSPLPIAKNVALGNAVSAQCALLGGAGGQSGLWVADADNAWWRVPDSDPPNSHLEHLRQQLPQWAPDGKKLAFTDGVELRVCDTTKRTTDVWFRSSRKPEERNPFQLLPPVAFRWYPDGTRIGFLDDSRLGLVTAAGWQKDLTETRVTAFSGWNTAGTRIAYVTTELPPYTQGLHWTTLFAPNMHARTALRTADADGANEKVLVSGLRATFPHWAPSESRLSVWLTVEPPYRLVTLDRSGMPPGDPAALIDPETGKIDWLPVKGAEHAQIGHVELRAGRLDAALKRFDDAATGLGADESADWMAFRAIALQKAGREAAAREAWKHFAPPTARRLAPMRVPLGPELPIAGDADAITARHRFIAEAFVSLEMTDEGIEYFRAQVRAAGSNADRLSAALALGQLLLLADRKTEFAECAATYLIPLAGNVAQWPVAEQGAVNATVAWTLLPLAVDEFVTALPEAPARRVSEKAIESSDAVDVNFVCLLVQRTCGRRLKDEKLVARAGERLARHPAQSRWNLTTGEVGTDALSRVWGAFLSQELIREHFGAATFNTTR